MEENVSVFVSAALRIFEILKGCSFENMSEQRIHSPALVHVIFVSVENYSQ